MKFKIELDRKKFDEIKEILENMDCEFENDEDVVKELFWIEDRYGNDADVRDRVKVKKISD